MDDKAKLSVDANIAKSTGGPRLPSPALNYFSQVPQKLQNSLKVGAFGIIAAANDLELDIANMT